MIPERFYDWIFYVSCFVFEKCFVDKESWYIYECSSFFLIFHECQTSVTEVVLYTRTKYLISEYFYKYFSGIHRSPIHLSFSDFWISCEYIEHVKTHRSICICWIEKYHIFCPLFWSKAEHIFCEISMRIYYTETITIPDILSSKVSYKYRFSPSRFSDHIVVSSSIFSVEVDRCFFVSILIPAHENSVFIDRESSECSVYFFYFKYIFSIFISYFYFFFEDSWICRNLEIMWNWKFFISEPADNRSFIVVDIWEMIECRNFICRENRYVLEEPYQLMLKSKISHRSKNKWE